MDDKGVVIDRTMDCEGTLAVKLIPKGTPAPEKTRLQKLIDIIEGQDQTIEAWRTRALAAEARVKELEEGKTELAP